MRRCLIASLVVVLCGILAVPAAAQQTTGNITGRVVDAQGAAVPGVTVTATQPKTGFTRTVVTDGEGLYRLTALPVGTFDLTIEITGSPSWSARASSSTSRRRSNLDVELKLAVDVGDGHGSRRDRR